MRWAKLPLGSVKDTAINTSSAATLMSVKNVWTAEPRRAPSRFTTVKMRTMTAPMAGTLQGNAGPNSTPVIPRISSPKNVASAPLVAGVVTRRKSQPKTKAAASP